MSMPKILAHDSQNMVILERNWYWVLFFLGFTCGPSLFYVSLFWGKGQLACGASGTSEKNCTFERRGWKQTIKLSFSRAELTNIRLRKRRDSEGDLVCRVELRIRGQWIVAHPTWASCNNLMTLDYQQFVAKRRSGRAYHHEFVPKIGSMGHGLLLFFIVMGLGITWYLSKRTLVVVDMLHEQVRITCTTLFLFENEVAVFPVEEVVGVVLGQEADADGDPTWFLLFELQDGETVRLGTALYPENKKEALMELREKLRLYLLGV